MSDSKEGWQTLVKRLKDAGVDLIECSFSCPQGNMGEDPGKMLAQSETATEKAAGWVKEAAGRSAGANQDHAASDRYSGDRQGGPEEQAATA